MHTKLFHIVLLLLLSNVCMAQQAEENRASNWLALQRLLLQKASARWSLSETDSLQIVRLQGESAFDVCRKQTAGCTFERSPLPVTGLKLKGHRINPEKVWLEWETKAEYNSLRFVVERQALDQATVFDSVYYQIGAGTSYTPTKYNDVDFNNYQQPSYYRIREVDVDGNYTYSNTIKVEGTAGQFAVAVTPNPAKSGNLRFYFTTSSPGQVVDFTISNAQGLQLIRREKFSVDNAYYEIKDHRFPPGYYFITVYTTKEVYTKAFVILE